MDIRFLAQSAVELTDGDTRVLVDPFITGNPKATVSADELDPTHILLTHGHGDHVRRHGRRSPSAPARRCSRSSSSRARSPRRASRSFDPNYGGTIAFDWGWVKLVPAWHTSTTPSGTREPALRPADPPRRQARLPPRRHRPVLRHAADRAARQPRRRRARADRRPLHDGPLRRRHGVRVHRRRHRDPDPLQHVPADRDRRRARSSRTSRTRPRARSSCSRRASRTRCGDPRDRPDRGRARRRCPRSAASSPTSRAWPRRGR